MKFKNPLEFIIYALKRADKSNNLIIGLSVESPSLIDGALQNAGGNIITGYFYNRKTNKFFDYFVIESRYFNISTASNKINNMRLVLDQFYY